MYACTPNQYDLRTCGGDEPDYFPGNNPVSGAMDVNILFSDSQLLTVTDVRTQVTRVDPLDIGPIFERSVFRGTVIREPAVNFVHPS